MDGTEAAQEPTTPPSLLLIGGRAGVGKTTVAWEVAAQLRAADISHAIIEGDFMGQIHPPPQHDPHLSAITERNLTAIWTNYAQLGCHRLIYTNTLSILPETAPTFHRALGPDVHITRVLLTATDTTTHQRLTARELGSELNKELQSSARKARLLEERSPSDTVRVRTDGRRVADIAHEVLTATGWAGPAHAGSGPSA
ncbi:MULTISPECIES: AAA family ATPase [Streptomyces]|uniref:AAA family ATPase n=1 Tax=Streptomyces koelreuteriae TaxID=2838015 RepID=A0ABX8FW77_9ACTN|nr:MULTISPECIES: AAA family ATPase [Streptomyces]QWB25321.1 AAA family ATPase [Streptomyces koelreuteriae]UUA08363.1 AAA family ATPase [Streptomyces koelreuteriae]UUA15969.1 AAA family ATPase [Streptomyces sp. CRCS-T-1]